MAAIEDRDPEFENEHEDADDEPQTVVKTGYMTKQGGSVKNWKKRWFVLTDKYLKYYKSEKTQNVQPLGLVFLRSVSKIERGVEGPNGMIDAFALTTPDRVYTFACANDREVRQWLDALKPYVNATGKVPEVLKEGWLVKQGGSVKSWRRRYFKLRTDKVLYYYKDVKDALSVGSIDLEKCNNIFCVPPTKYNHPNAFELVTPSRTFPVYATTYDEMKDWLAQLGALLGFTIAIPEPTEAGAVDANGNPFEESLDTPATPGAEGVTSAFGGVSLDEGVLKEGYLTKQGGAIKTWKRRYFRLHSHRLDYFKEQKDTLPQGTIDLTKVISVEPTSKKLSKPFVFEVATRPRVYPISAGSEDEMWEWVRAIQEVLSKLPPPTDDGALGADYGNDDD